MYSLWLPRENMFVSLTILPKPSAKVYWTFSMFAAWWAKRLDPKGYWTLPYLVYLKSVPLTRAELWRNSCWSKEWQVRACNLCKNILNLCDQLRSCSVIEDCFVVIKSIPNVWPFVGWQILCDLTEASIITVNSLDDWAELGPGACKGLMYIFQCRLSEQFSLIKKLTVITKQADRKFSSLSIPPPLTINCKLVEHALCEFSKYCRTSTQDLGANNENQYMKPLWSA